MIGNDTFTYRRCLPHLSKNEKTYFVTFVTRNRRVLEPVAREMTLRACLHDHGKKCWTHCAVVMPDHVHILITPFDGVSPTSLVAAIKSSSAHRINRAFGRQGPIWQSESFDHILRSNEQLIEKANYIAQNPVRKGLVDSSRDWPWTWSAYLTSM